MSHVTQSNESCHKISESVRPIFCTSTLSVQKISSVTYEVKSRAAYGMSHVVQMNASWHIYEFVTENKLCHIK